MLRHAESRHAERVHAERWGVQRCHAERHDGTASRRFSFVHVSCVRELAKLIRSYFHHFFPCQARDRKEKERTQLQQSRCFSASVSLLYAQSLSTLPEEALREVSSVKFSDAKVVLVHGGLVLE